MRKDYCSQEQFEGLHAELDKVRSTSATVKVSKDALRALLMDHANLQRIKEGNSDQPE